MAAFDKKRFAIVAAVTRWCGGGQQCHERTCDGGIACGSRLIVLSGCLSMKEMYDAIEWKVVFLMAGAFSLGFGMHNSGLDMRMAGKLVDVLGPWYHSPCSAASTSSQAAHLI